MIAFRTKSVVSSVFFNKVSNLFFPIEILYLSCVLGISDLLRHVSECPDVADVSWVWWLVVVVSRERIWVSHTDSNVLWSWLTKGLWMDPWLRIHSLCCTTNRPLTSLTIMMESTPLARSWTVEFCPKQQ